MGNYDIICPMKITNNLWFLISDRCHKWRNFSYETEKKRKAKVLQRMLREMTSEQRLFYDQEEEKKLLQKERERYFTDLAVLPSFRALYRQWIYLVSSSAGNNLLNFHLYSLLEFTELEEVNCIHPLFYNYKFGRLIDVYPFHIEMVVLQPALALFNFGYSLQNTRIHNFGKWTYYIEENSDFNKVEKNKLIFGFSSLIDATMAKLIME
jgi:hypothetical protein